MSKKLFTFVIRILGSPSFLVTLQKKLCYIINYIITLFIDFLVTQSIYIAHAFSYFVFPFFMSYVIPLSKLIPFLSDLSKFTIFEKNDKSRHIHFLSRYIQ